MTGAHVSDAERRAAAVADRIGRAQAVGGQLSLIADDGPAPEKVEAKPAGPGRPKGAKNKSGSELRKWLAARGMRMPEQTLAGLAMLDTRGDVFLAAMERAEQVAAWAFGDSGGSSAQRLAIFMEILKQARAAADALAPYGLAKMSADVNVDARTVVLNLPEASGPAPSAPGMRTVGAGRTAPPPFPGEIQQNQGVSEEVADQSDGSQSDDGEKA